jgi:cytochrome b subunit of formate dehydrogenase
VDASFTFESSFDNYISTSYFYVILATILLILGMVLWAYAVLLTQEANSHAFEMIFHFGVTNMCVSALLYMVFLKTNESVDGDKVSVLSN